MTAVKNFVSGAEESCQTLELLSVTTIQPARVIARRGGTEVSYPTGHAQIKVNSKWLPSLRLWACTIDRIGNGRSDARRKLRHRGPARYKMERIYVSAKAICQGSVELASLMKKKEERRKKKEERRRKKEKIQFLPPSGSGCRRSFAKVFTCIQVQNHT